MVTHPKRTCFTSDILKFVSGTCHSALRSGVRRKCSHEQEVRLSGAVYITMGYAYSLRDETK